MKYLLLSYTHKNTDIVTREKLACSSEELLKKFHESFKSFEDVKEVLVLSTCNRVEIFLAVKKYDDLVTKVQEKLAELTTASLDEIKSKGEVYKAEEAVRHMFLVASSLDSLVIGETQITGQLKDAFRFSFDHGFCGQSIARVMMNSFKCSSAVRSSSDITKNPVSVASVAVAKAKDIFGGNLGGYTGVVVGAGEMGEIVAKHLAKSGANIMIVNRNMEKAYELAEKLEGVTVVVEPFSKLKEIVNNYRLLFSATGAKGIVISSDMIEKTTFQRHWFDIAVPRDIEVSNHDDINIYAVDDLKEQVDKNIKEREENAKGAYAIVDKFVENFYKWLDSLSIEPVIKELRLKAEEASKKELQKAIKKGYIPKELEKTVIKTMQNAFKSFLHTPTKNIKKIAGEPQADVVVQAMQMVFDINIDTKKALNAYKCDYLLEKDIFKK
jgi:glutamyl-tRNA reductase